MAVASPIQNVLSPVAADETFNNTWPFAARFTNAPGFRMHYVDEGNGETILALHGELTWGYLFRNLITPLHRSTGLSCLTIWASAKAKHPSTEAISFMITSTTSNGSSLIRICATSPLSCTFLVDPSE